MPAKSRYAATPSFDPDPRGNADFRGLRPREIGPALGVVEHRIVDGDRLDLLAGDYFNEDRRWWRIADANPRFLHAGDMTTVFQAPPAGEADEEDPLGREDMTGAVILIPKARE